MTTLGKARHLAASTTAGGHFNILAIDHRGNLWEELAKGGALTDSDFTAFKRDVITALAPFASAVLTDPAYGIAPGVSEGWLPPSLGLLAPLEVTDYDQHPSRRRFNPIPDWSVGRIKRIGAAGVKLLLYYHPKAENAPTQRAIAATVIAECEKYDVPLYLEPIVYSPRETAPLTPNAHRDAVVVSAATFAELGADILKMQFPAEIAHTNDESEWRSALREVDEVCSVPWTLLSGGVSYDVFKRQALLACEAGASGIIAGRALWKEAINIPPADRRAFLETVSAPRLRELSNICASAARPYTEKVAPPPAELGWMRHYGEM
jgi:tagatose 1,6-diphosphate aldolase